MNCESARKLLSAERDETLGADVRTALDAHVAGCDGCRKLRALLAESAAAWRVNTEGARAPDERLEWQRLRRRLTKEGSERGGTRWWRGTAGWRGVTLASAVTALAAAAFLLTPATEHNDRPAVAVAPTDTVEVGGDASAAMVFVDEKSGWLVVWASNAADGG